MPARLPVPIVGGGVGGVAAALAAHCLDQNVKPHQVHATDIRLQDVQSLLHRRGTDSVGFLT